MLHAAFSIMVGVSIPSNGSIQFLHCGFQKRWKLKWYRVSIPSNGSIQFLRLVQLSWRNLDLSLNPLKRVNSILTTEDEMMELGWKSLNPLKRVNSILTRSKFQECFVRCIWSQSPQAGQFNSYLSYIYILYIYSLSIGLNPLKRVNSILTWNLLCLRLHHLIVSIPSSGSIQFLPWDISRALH